MFLLVHFGFRVDASRLSVCICVLGITFPELLAIFYSFRLSVKETFLNDVIYITMHTLSPGLINTVRSFSPNSVYFAFYIIAILCVNEVVIVFIFMKCSALLTCFVNERT